MPETDLVTADFARELERENAALRNEVSQLRADATLFATSIIEVEPALHQRIAELERDLAACKRDAERYRWLRDDPHSWWHTMNLDAAPGLAQRIDAEVDRSMEEALAQEPKP